MPWPAFSSTAPGGTLAPKAAGSQRALSGVPGLSFSGPGTLMAWWLHRQRSLSPDAILGHPEENLVQTQALPTHTVAQAWEIQPIADVLSARTWL